MIWLLLFFGLFMGWALGTNDSANAFGTAVASGSIHYRTAAAVIAVAVLLGAALMGAGNLEAISALAAANRVSFTEREIQEAIQRGCVETLRLHSAGKAAAVLFCAGVTVFLMSVLRFPVSANQSLAGAIIGWGLCRADYGNPTVLALNLSQIGRFLAAWVMNPLVAGVTAYLLVRCFGGRLKGVTEHNQRFLRLAYLTVGALAAVSIGVNSSGAVTALYFDAAFSKTGIAANLLTNARTAAILGGASIALGALTYSHRVMQTVGSNITRLTPSDGLLSVLATAISVTVMSRWLGIPVSTSEAVVGAVVGVGLARGRNRVQFLELGRIASAWVCSPVIAGASACILANLTRRVLL